MQSQLVCCGCRHFLLYPRGASNVRCSICNTINSITPPAMETAQLVCVGCQTLLMYPRGATSVRCACCHTTNDARTANAVAQVNCSHCHTTLAYPSGAPSVKCALCHYITNVGINNVRVSIPVHRPGGPTPLSMPSTTASMPNSYNQTVVVENPMTVDESGKLKLSKQCCGGSDDREKVTYKAFL